VTSVDAGSGHPAPPSDDALPLTGERTVPGIARENYWFRRHEAAYRHLAPWCNGAVVLEAGCGEGYGAALLAHSARQVLALDYDADTARHVARRYPQLAAVRANLAAVPVRTSTVDVVANLQVIEHLWDPPGFLAECARVLRPGGLLLVTTPNRLTFSPGRETPLNPFHTEEFAPSELDALLRAAGFAVRHMTGLHHGCLLRGLDEKHGGSLVDTQLAQHGDSWPPELLGDVAGVRAGDFTVASGDLDRSLDLIAVATTR
jgi:SAM-dependent methyltransferase